MGAFWSGGKALEGKDIHFASFRRFTRQSLSSRAIFFLGICMRVKVVNVDGQRNRKGWQYRTARSLDGVMSPKEKLLPRV
jgi:hypothetical protein